MTLRRHTKYDLELRAEDEFFGYMLDRSADAPDVAVAEADQAASIALSSQRAAGDYNWKDQRTMPGVAISDFRAGQGQRVLDRKDSASNAFRDGRFLNCEKEGEVSLAPGLITVINDDLEACVIEAGGVIWGAFIPEIAAPPDETNPNTVRWLKRYTVTLTNELTETHYAAFDETVTDLMQVGDILYDPENREAMQVVDMTDDPSIEVAFNAGWFDNTASETQVHPAGQVLQCYGWRTVEFDFESIPQPDNHPPREHCRSFAFDGSYLYAAFADTSGNGSIWRVPVAFDIDGNLPEASKLERILELGGVVDLAYGLGRLYYAQQGDSETLAGYIGYNALGTSLEATQLTFDAVVGESWDTDHFEPDERKLMAPLVYSKGLVMNGTWCYWLTQSGRNSWLYRMQAPQGFELVKPFPKGFIATCLESAFDNVFTGGYYYHADGTVEGVVYIVQGDTAERVVTLDDFTMDNTIKGLTAVGRLIWIVTNTQVFCYNVKTAGWWHVMDLPPANPSTSIAIVDEDLWLEFDLPVGTDLEPQTAHPNEWDRIAQSTNAPEKTAWGTGTLWHDLNTRYSEYEYASDIPDDDAAARFFFPAMNAPTGAVPDDGYAGVVKRRALEVRLQNGSREARFRVYGRRSGKYWLSECCLGSYNPKTKRWNFETKKLLAWPNFFVPYYYEFYINAAGAGVLFGYKPDGYTEFIGPLNYMNPQSNARLKPVTGRKIRFWCGIPKCSDTSVKTSSGWKLETDSDIVTNKNFRIALDEVDLITENVAPYSTAVVSEGTGQVAELDGEVFIPIAGDETYDSKLAFTRYGETYTGTAAFIETSDSYQGMGTAQKYYRRMELAYPVLEEGQTLTGEAIIDDAIISESADIAAEYVGEENASGSSVLTMKSINKGGIKARVKVGMQDDDHLRGATKLRINSIGLRFLPNSSALKHVYTVACIDEIECRDGTLWDLDANDAIEFIRRLKKSGEVFKITDDGGTYEAVVDTYQIAYDQKDEHGIGPRQGTVQFTVKVIDE